jgi:hypothetical protein
MGTLERLRRQAQRRWAPVYLKGLILPGERESVEPRAATGRSWTPPARPGTPSGPKQAASAPSTSYPWLPRSVQTS